ncbi:MAG: Lrp/AsnC family transcriptional regulator [Bacillota bacterium]|nr:Lrp/AsnC family transcriptional regulator [Bacillota bacterium]
MENMKKELLEILSDNSRLSTETIGAMLGVSQAEVEKAMTELENDKVILKYSAVVNWDKTSRENMVSARIDVQVQPQREVGFDDIARRICRFPEVKSMQLVSGKFDFFVMVEAKTMMDVSNFVSCKLSTIDGVKSTCTNFVLKSYKENEMIYDDDNTDNRQVVTA